MDDGIRAHGLEAALEAARDAGGALAALQTRGVARLGDDAATPAFAAFLVAADDGVATIAECIALGYLWRDLAAEVGVRAFRDELAARRPPPRRPPARSMPA